MTGGTPVSGNLHIWFCTVVRPSTVWNGMPLFPKNVPLLWTAVNLQAVKCSLPKMNFTVLLRGFQMFPGLLFGWKTLAPIPPSWIFGVVFPV